jgi:alpha-tubulin suppressor-like RCC1 family protein
VQLPRRDRREQLLPVAVEQVSCGISHTCAPGVDNEVYCWGKNEFPQLGRDTSPDILVMAPGIVTGLP